MSKPGFLLTMPATKNKTVIIVEGPTAVGKTAAGIAIAEHFKTEIISADSRQCYRELNIGVARPSPGELQQIKHHFIASHSIRDEINAAGFEQYALKKAAELFEQYDNIVMVGGTGLYIKAFCEGLDEIPCDGRGPGDLLNRARSQVEIPDERLGIGTDDDLVAAASTVFDHVYLAYRSPAAKA